MDCTARFLPYEKTNQFSSLVLDYLRGAAEVKPLYAHPVNLQGFRDAMAGRKRFPTDRALIAGIFEELYREGATEKQRDNIVALRSENTFTVTTAHQPNIFTGYLYFVYKIIHAIKLAEEMKVQMPECHFVPVFYIGSEDNDLDELGQVNLGGEKLIWNTRQQGAVGRMKVDNEFLELIRKIEGQLGVEPYGIELVSLLRDSYREGQSIAESTFRLVNHLFASHGLLVLQPDDGRLKRVMRGVFEDDLFQHLPHKLVHQTGDLLQAKYKVQVNPREINLFYLIDDIRERITFRGDHFEVVSAGLQFSTEQIREELAAHPERFSPNVVLRGLYQEMILPNIAFVGGGAETAYWLELKALFDHYSVPFPVLVMRNSFMLATYGQEKKLSRMGLRIEDLFATEFEIMNEWVRQKMNGELDITHEKNITQGLFDALKQRASAVDHTLVQHIDALHTRLQNQLDGVGKKMLRAEKRKYENEKNQLGQVRQVLFPLGKLQERVDNFMPWYARMGAGFLDGLYRLSPGMEQHFGIIVFNP